MVRLERAYEVLYIVRSDVEEEAYAQVIGKYEQLISELGGSVTNVDEWGIRSFAYEIEHLTKGYYVLMTFWIDPQQLPELDRQFQLDENVLRYQVVRLEEERVPSPTAVL